MRKTAPRLIAAGLTAAALTLGLTASAVTARATVAAPAASSALRGPTCHGLSCVGLDPYTHGCTISNTYGPHGDSLATLWGEFSNNCDAKWALGQLTAQAVRNHDTMEVAVGTNDNPESEFMCWPGPTNTGQPNEFCSGTYGGSNVARTDMVYGHLSATAFVYIFGPTGHQIDQISVTF